MTAFDNRNTAHSREEKQRKNCIEACRFLKEIRSIPCGEGHLKRRHLPAGARHGGTMNYLPASPDVSHLKKEARSRFCAMLTPANSVGCARALIARGVAVANLGKYAFSPEVTA
jgi:hypothetical protein